METDFQCAGADIQAIFDRAGATTPEKKALVVAEILVNAFSWGRTKEGFLFWEDVYNKLNDLKDA